MCSIRCLIMALMVIISASASAQSPQKWVTQLDGLGAGPYPIGNPSAQPDLRLAFPSPETGARDQSFRLIVRPDLWGGQGRLRFPTRSAQGRSPSIAYMSACSRPLRRLSPAATSQSASPARARLRWLRGCRSGAMRSILALCARSCDGGIAWPQTGGQLPHHRRKRPDDLAC